LQQVFDADGMVWNTALGRWADMWRYEDRTRLTYVDAAAELTDWRSRYVWLAAQPVDPQQQTLRDLFHAISAFKDTNNPAARPWFKARKAGYATARWTKNSFAVLDGRLEVATSAGRISLRIVWSRDLRSEPGMATIRRDRAGRWWVSLTVQVELPDADPRGQSTGLDLGLTTFATTEFADADMLARKQIGSRNRTRTKTRVAKLHAKVADQRRDFAHKQARKLARRFGRVGVEDLRIKNISRRGKDRRKVGLNRSIADAAWSNLVCLLESHAIKCGHEIARLPARDTTQTCSRCGVKANPRLELSDRVFRCSRCPMVQARDRNPARNLNPDRWDKSVWVGKGVDGAKPSGSADPEAA
jgi:putative transposase